MQDQSKNKVALAWGEEMAVLKAQRAELISAVDTAILNLKDMALRNRQSLALTRTQAVKILIAATITALGRIGRHARIGSSYGSEGQ